MPHRKFLNFVLFLFLCLSFCQVKVTAQVDSVAVSILDKMSDVLTALNTCSLKLKTEYDIYDDQLGLVKNSDKGDIFLKGPDKVLVKHKGDKGNKEFYYDGKNLTYYSVDNNQYATAPAPPTIMEMIDEFHDKYGMDFPAAELFYPDLVDEILEVSNIIAYLGITNVEDKDCYHIAGATDSLTYQLWVANDGSFLPVKIGIVYTIKLGAPQYEAVYSNWELNPALDDSMFDFAVPSGAKKIKIILKPKEN